MDNYIFRKANHDDVNFLTKMRMEVIKKANDLDENEDMDTIFTETQKYYANYFDDTNHITYLAFDGDIFIGCGSICFYTIMPTYKNQIGKKAHIMNLYTKENYRRKGIGTNILGLLIKEANDRDIKQIQIETTEIGRYLYKKYGFVEMNNEMELRVSLANRLLSCLSLSQ